MSIASEFRPEGRGKMAEIRAALAGTMVSLVQFDRLGPIRLLLIITGGPVNLTAR